MLIIMSGISGISGVYKEYNPRNGAQCCSGAMAELFKKARGNSSPSAPVVTLVLLG